MPISFEGLSLATVAEDQALHPRMEALIQRVWPAFVIHSHSPKGHTMPADWSGVYTRWPHYQFSLLEPQTGILLAAGNFLALAWDGAAEDLPDTGWEWAMFQGEADHHEDKSPVCACALSVTIDPDHLGRGLSSVAVRAMQHLARAAGYTRLIAPVRPTWKHRYPITPIAEYMRWTGPDGLPFDPWIRVHARLGARVVRPCTRSMLLAGTVAEWEAWTGLPLPASGEFVAPGLLSTLHVDRAAGECICVEPNVWMEHRLDVL